MQSKWEVITDKVIKVTIKDNDFKKLVLNKGFTIVRGKELYVELEEEKELNEKDEIMNVKYSILKVISENNESEQMELL